MALFYQLLPPTLIIFHLVFIVAKGYFLPFEFSLYPYLQNHDFLPYKNIIDQHFPTIFFGPLAIPAFLTANPQIYLGFFLTVLGVTDLLFFQFLKRHKINNQPLFLLLFITLSAFFSGNNFWVEIFINLFLCFWLATFSLKNKYFDFVSGFLFLQVILARPTISLSLVCLFFFFQKVRPSYVKGFLFGVFLIIYYLGRNQLWVDFYDLTYRFNQSTYIYLGQLHPSKREILYILLLLIPATTNLGSKKTTLLSLSQIFSLLAAYPRFGLEHLQPFILISVLSVANSKYSRTIGIGLTLIFLALNTYGYKNFRYGNYFYSQDVLNISQKIKELGIKEIALLGANDLIYVTSQTLPPNLYYLPTLPWYLHSTNYQARLFDSISTIGSVVLIDRLRQVDGKNILEYFPAIIDFVSKDFESIYQDDRYQIYEKVK